MDGGSLSEHLSKVSDPRRNIWLERHSFRDILIIAVCATIGGADSFEEIASFGRSKLEWLKSFLDLPNGIFSHDTFNRIFVRMDHEPFKEGSLSWVRSFCVLCEGEVIAIDGKNLRRSSGGVEQSFAHRKRLGV